MEQPTAESSRRRRPCQLQQADDPNYSFKAQDDSILEKLRKVWNDVGEFISDPEVYGAFGRFGRASRPDLTAERRGNRLRVKGSVTHDFAGGNRFDFNEGQLGSVEASTLEAQPYDLHFDRRQDVDAELEYELNRGLTLRRARWGSIR